MPIQNRVKDLKYSKYSSKIMQYMGHNPNRRHNE